VHVRVCLTHLDERAPGFLELSEIRRAEGERSGLRPPAFDATPPFNVARGAPIEDRIAPIGKLLLAALRDAKTAPHAQVEAWLDASAIPSDLRAPFFAAISRAYALGRADLERAVEQAYDRDVLPGVMPLLERFPFNPQSDTDAAATDVEAAFGPKGSFFVAFSAQIAPLCQQTAPGVYRPIDVPTGGGSASGSAQLRVPRGALRLVAWATRLQALLFSADGKPRPIPFNVQALPLPSVETVRTVTLGYVRAGATTVYGSTRRPRGSRSGCRGHRPTPLRSGCAPCPPAAARRATNRSTR
jgi:type VI secretion system protein ImpL